MLFPYKRIMVNQKTIVCSDLVKLCMGCFHQRSNHRYGFGQQNNRLLCGHPKCKCIQFVEWI